MKNQRNTLSRLALALCALAASAAPSASAQEAGRLVIFSHLSEPLTATAPLALPSGAVASDVTARVASEQIYAASGARRPSWASQARIEARALDSKRVELRVTTSAPIEDPASTLILEIEVKGAQPGSATKQYAVILDPLEMGKPLAKADPADRSPGLGAQVAPAPSAPAAAAKAPVSADSGRVVVKSGQILFGIAQAKRPADVSVERMMVGMLRVNPQAFVQGNVNRLKAGAVLRMPKARELAGIGQAEAVQEINRQAGDFAKWRSAAASAPAEISQPKAPAGEGKVERAPSAPENGPDVLRLGKAQAGKPDATDAIAQKAREAEARERVAELEKMQESLKKTLTLNAGASLAAAQAGAENASPAETKAEEAKAEDAKTEAPAEAIAAASEEAKPEAIKPAPKPAPRPVAAPPEPTPEPSMGEELAAHLEENGIYIGGALALALLGAGALIARRRKAKNGFSGPTTIVPDAGSTHAPAASASQEPEVSEFQAHLNSADTYLAFNKLDRAAEEIRAALEIEPKNLDALIMGARVAARSQDREALARLVAQIGDLSFKTGAYWEEADALLVQSSRGAPEEPEAPTAAHVDFSDDLERSLMDLAATSPAPTTLVKEPVAAPNDPLDFAIPSFDLPSKPASDPFKGAAQSPEPLEDPRSETLSFDLSLPDDPPSFASASDSIAFEAPDASPPAQAPESDVEGELKTMLDLANAYVEMGDKDGARELLTEIENKGSPALSAKAKALIATL